MPIKTSLDKEIFFPPKEIYVNDYQCCSFVRQYLNYLNSDLDKKKRFMDIFSLNKLDIPSDLSRPLVSKPNAPLYISQKLITRLSDALRIAKETSSKVCLAHPAHMYHDIFDTRDYIKTMLDFSKSIENASSITMLSGPYMLDDEKDAEDIAEMARRYSLRLLPSSDANSSYRKQKDNGETTPYMYLKYGDGKDDKVFYTPRPGFAIRPFITSFMKENNVQMSFVDFLYYVNSYKGDAISLSFYDELENCPPNMSISKELADSFSSIDDKLLKRDELMLD